MRIGFIDCDAKNSKKPFPNLAIMKLSAWHKQKGDVVEWYNLIDATAEYMTTGKNMYDRVYVSKVFSFSDDYDGFIFADEVIKGGSGYAITLETVGGAHKEVYNATADKPLAEEIEHIYPNYELYGIYDTAYGFITRGCPRGCDFCHVKAMQGNKAHKVAELSEFWNGQSNIVLLDPNITACKEWRDVFQQLINSGAWVDFSQGLDLRLLTEEKIKLLMQIKTRSVHFAWDRVEDEASIIPNLEALKRITGWEDHKIVVYVLVGNKEPRVTDTDLYRIYKLREIGVFPYVMIYEKYNLKKGHELRKLQRWVNNRWIWKTCATFEQYLNGANE